MVKKLYKVFQNIDQNIYLLRNPHFSPGKLINFCLPLIETPQRGIVSFLRVKFENPLGLTLSKKIYISEKIDPVSSLGIFIQV